MLLHKCDKCGKAIPASAQDGTVRIGVDGRFASYELCKTCSEPIAKILRTYTLAK